ncbi:hypothetical protein HaLaN_00882 [Haematococcus lacustris]|uniref:Uncharacterized protein n=1 Tax=Haematococcus lacustris TaxID=44745 RepID=A0A699Y7W5_HAELA|nr:hypothetical protein HaLaN_00882 [Haematococcus lacustris]
MPLTTGQGQQLVVHFSRQKFNSPHSPPDAYPLSRYQQWPQLSGPPVWLTDWHVTAPFAHQVSIIAFNCTCDKPELKPGAQCHTYQSRSTTPINLKHPLMTKVDHRALHAVQEPVDHFTVTVTVEARSDRSTTHPTWTWAQQGSCSHRMYHDMLAMLMMMAWQWRW